jgi:HD-GYP domain-containing protein (c-di-GMP phosphodiesterase class II)
MSEQTKIDKLHTFYSNICISFVQGIRTLSLYPKDHPETQKKVELFFKLISQYLKQRPHISILFTGGEVIVENRPLPELSASLSKFIKQLEAIKLQRFIFQRGIDLNEVGQFFELLLPLLKKSDGADLVLEKNQGNFPHVLAGSIPVDASPQVSYEEFTGGLQSASKSVQSFSEQLKDMFTDLEGPIPESKVAQAKETTRTIYDMNLSGELPLKVLFYRSNKDPDPYLHAINVSAMSMALAGTINLDESVIQDVGLGALLHDIGLHLPALEKQLTEAETPLEDEDHRFEHPVRGAEILLASSGIPDLVPLVAYEHHIQYDGGGYPEQKTYRDINLASLITFITNSYDDLRRNRPGQAARSLTDALNWMDQRLGTHYHPLIYKKFRGLVKAQVDETV